jgi:hypothetical protein
MYEIDEGNNPYRFRCFLTLGTCISLTYKMGIEGKSQAIPVQTGQTLMFPGG